MTAIVARESIEMSRAVAVGTGHMSPANAKALQKAWLRDAGLAAPPKPLKQMTRPTPLFEGMGVEIVPPRAKVEGDGGR